MDLSQAARQRVDEPPRALAVRLQLLGQRERGATVSADERVRQSVGLRGGVACREPLEVAAGQPGLGMQGERELLELAGDALLASADERNELLGRVHVRLQPELAGPLD